MKHYEKLNLVINTNTACPSVGESSGELGGLNAGLKYRYADPTSHSQGVVGVFEHIGE